MEWVVSVELKPDGYVISCPGSGVVGDGPTESDAWWNFWGAARASWKPPEAGSTAPGDRLPQRRHERARVRTIRVRDLLG